MYEAGDCPKCGGKETGYEVVQSQVWFRCSCGRRELRYERNKDGIIIRHTENRNMRLPKKGTKLYACLIFVAEHEGCRTGDVAMSMKDSASKVATQLTVLMCRGYITRVDTRRGVAGGSSWELTAATKKILQLT